MISSIKWDKYIKQFYVVTEKGVTDKLYVYNLETEKLTELDSPVDIIYKVHVAKSGAIYVLGLSATLPMNIFRLTPKGEWEQLTQNNVLGVDEEQMGEQDVINYEYFDMM